MAERIPINERVAMARAASDTLDAHVASYRKKLNIMFPVGLELHYLRHGKTPQPARILQHAGNYGRDWKVRVMNLRTQKLIWVGLYDIERGQEAMV